MHLFSALRALLLILPLSCMSPGAWAQDTLTHIAKTGELRLGHREASHPFSYKDPATGQVRG